MNSDCLLSAAAVTIQATLQSGDWLCLGSALLSVDHFVSLRFNFFLCNTKKWTPWFLRRPAPSPPLVAGPHMFCTQWLSECFFPHRCWRRDELLCGVCSEWPCPLLSSATCSSGKWDPFPALPLPTVPSPLLPRFLLSDLLDRSSWGPNSTVGMSFEFFGGATLWDYLSFYHRIK